VQQVAQYKEATLVQQGPARDGFVAAVSQQLADRHQDCRQLVKGKKVELGNKEPTASLKKLSAANDSGKNKGGEPSTCNNNARNHDGGNSALKAYCSG
jgi:hypothetical protein